MGELILKIFVSNKYELPEEFLPLLAEYDSFVLVKVTQSDAHKLTSTYPFEDITDQYTIRMGADVIDTRKPRINPAGKTQFHPAYRRATAVDHSDHHYLVQFIGPIKPQWLRSVKRLGGTIRGPLQNFTQIVQANENEIQGIAAQPYVRWVGHWRHEHRIAIDKKREKLPRTHFLENVYEVHFFDKQCLEGARRTLKKCDIKVLNEDKRCSMTMFECDQSSKVTQKILAEISAIHGVKSIRQKSIKRTSNNVAARIMNVKLAVSEPTELTGANEIVAVCDTGLDSGDVDNMHPDFEGRVIGVESYPITATFDPFINNPGADDGVADLDSGHGTHVSGSVLGNGAGGASIVGLPDTIKGIAPDASLFFQAIEQELDWIDPNNAQRYGRYLLAGIPDDLTGLFQSAFDHGARIHSNSWGGGEPGAYDSQSEQLDAFVWNNKEFCVLVAAGNDGTDKDGSGRINPLSVTSPGTAKNCITIGASESLRPQFSSSTYGSFWPNDYPVPPIAFDEMASDPEQVVAFSSRGPTIDGRFKPDLVAPGTYILSTRSRFIAPSNKGWGAYPQSDLYFYMGGTSMATPLVSGAVALLRQFLRQWVGIEEPSAALIKAALIVSAVKLEPAGPEGIIPNIDQGYGLINLDGITTTPEDISVFFYENVDGLSTGETIEETLQIHTSDLPLRVSMAYTDFPGPALVNNLNLILEAPDGTLYAGNQESNGGLTMDTRNNTEVVHIEFPVTGEWKIRVLGSNVPNGPQDFALCFRGNIS